MIKYLYIIIFLLSHNLLQAQSIHFSQLYSADVMINPSNTGNFQGNWRINNIYREQGNNFTEPFRTLLVGFDKHFYAYDKQFSAGIFYINDMSAQNSLMVNKFNFTGAYHIRLSQKLILRFGMQAGVVQKSNNTNNLTLPEQFDITTGQFNSNLTSSETFAHENIKYLDLGSGILLKYNASETEIEIGGAAFQLNKPQESFMNTSIEIPVKSVFHGYVKKKTGNRIYLKPQFYFTTVKKASELVLGTQIAYEFNNVQGNSEVYAAFHFRGGINRNADAVIASAGFVHHNWNFCFSYDYDVSGLHLMTSRSNAFEVSIIYIRPETFVKQKVVPCSVF